MLLIQPKLNMIMGTIMFGFNQLPIINLVNPINLFKCNKIMLLKLSSGYFPLVSKNTLSIFILDIYLKKQIFKKSTQN
ncbi:hypothetical protein B1202_12505 [Acinetobacter amyesii]|uniref:Uncharacterized protein n=1 Tax=Acinetobacter amyesii TaxID=2942470 RepID=A0A1T1GTQ5_9GAMM|nr:hypothetical protein B1202_12505 [Acinetobacter amyesii]